MFINYDHNITNKLNKTEEYCHNDSVNLIIMIMAIT